MRPNVVTRLAWAMTRDVVTLTKALTIQVHFNQLKLSNEQFEFYLFSRCVYLYLLSYMHAQYVLNLIYLSY